VDPRERVQGDELGGPRWRWKGFAQLRPLAVTEGERVGGGGRWAAARVSLAARVGANHNSMTQTSYGLLGSHKSKPVN
jgi:hypothetical protein